MIRTGKTFDLRPYSINDFKEWSERGELRLAPYFQRRRVWSNKAKSYLIDTILRGLPMPPIYMRQHIDQKTRKTVREVIDGQQRLATTLDFLKDGFKVSKVHNETFGNLYFSELPPITQDDFLQYVISADLILSSRDEDALNIFARLNTYTVMLNKQERLNSKYFGAFKQTVYNLGYEFYTFWRKMGILTEQKISRMAEAELASELIIAMISGLQSKNVIESFYKKYDDDFRQRDEIKKKFKRCIDTIGEIYGEILPNSYFKGIPPFYSLFCVIYDLLFGLKGSEFKERQITIKPADYPKIRIALENLESSLMEPDQNPEIMQFIGDCTRHTTNLPERKRRHNFLLNFILNYLERSR